MVHTMKSEGDPWERRRRQHDRAFKAEMVRQSLLPGASVSAIALRNGINANMLFTWRREHRRTSGLTEARTVLLPVEVASQGEVATVPAPVVATRPAPEPPRRDYRVGGRRRANAGARPGRRGQPGVISVFVQIVAVALWRRVQNANTPSALQNRDDSHENRGHPWLVTATRENVTPG